MNQLKIEGEGFPATIETWQFINEMIQQLSQLGKAYPDNSILTGCVDTNGQVSAGYLIIGGELAYFAGGALGTHIQISEDAQKVTYIEDLDSDGQPDELDTYIRRTAIFSTTGVKWDLFKQMKLEPAFTKKTVFNKDFGAGANDVAEGDKAFLHRVDYTTDDPLDFDSFLAPGSRNIYFNHNTYDANGNENGDNPNPITNNPLDIIDDTFTAKEKRDLRGVLTVTIGGRPDNISTIPITPDENYLVQNYYDYFHGHFYRVRYYTTGVFTSWKNAETSSAKIYTGGNAPSNSIGKLGDIYLQRNQYQNGGIYEGSSANRGTYVGRYNGVIWIKSWYPNGSGGTYEKWLKLPMTSA